MWNPNLVWNRWKEMTRLFVGLDASSDCFIAEWNSKLADQGADTVISIKWRGKSDFEAPATELLELLSQKKHLGRMLLVYSYVLTEGFAREVLEHLGDCSSLAENGIESWSSRILNTKKIPWERVYKGKLGLMEVSFARNAIVHEFTNYSERDIKRCATAQVSSSWKIGDPIPLALDDVLDLRYRLQCFIRVICQEITEQSSP